MAKTMKRITVILVVLSAVLGMLDSLYDSEIWLALMITSSTTAYHFAMRLFVGYFINRKMKNKADYNRRWYRVGAFEMKFYDLIKVKKWKRKMPSYNPELFSPKMHSWDEIAQAMCQAEVVHETIAVLSFLPLILSIRWGAFWVFLITSIAAACLDIAFAIMQRYNRPRVLKLMERR